MPQFAVAATLMLTHAAVYQAADKDELREIVRKQLMRDGGDGETEQWRLEVFELADADMKIAEIAAKAEAVEGTPQKQPETSAA